MKNKKILIVEDNPVNLKLLESLLIKAGYKVLSAETGEKALELLDKGDIPNLVLLDIELPGINGTNVGESIMSNPKTRDIPVYYLTGLMSKEEELALKNKLFGNLFFSKPYDPKVLLDTIAKEI